MQLGVNDEAKKNFSFTNGALNLQISIASSGYVPGQMVNTVVNYANSTNISIRRVCTKLLRVSNVFILAEILIFCTLKD